jgi:putative oxidoreductase
MTPQPLARWAPVVLRLMVGYGLAAHGIAKLLRGPEAFVAVVQAMHVPAPWLMAWLTIATELVGGFAVLVGALIWLASVPILAVLLVAMFTVHWPYGFSSIKLLAITSDGAQFGPPGYEINLLYAACIVALVLTGPGPLSVDGVFRNHKR